MTEEGGYCIHRNNIQQILRSYTVFMCWLKLFLRR